MFNSFITGTHFYLEPWVRLDDFYFYFLHWEGAVEVRRLMARVFTFLISIYISEAAYNDRIVSGKNLGMRHCTEMVKNKAVSNMIVIVICTQVAV